MPAQRGVGTVQYVCWACAQLLQFWVCWLGGVHTCLLLWVQDGPADVCLWFVCWPDVASPVTVTAVGRQNAVVRLGAIRAQSALGAHRAVTADCVTQMLVDTPIVQL